LDDRQLLVGVAERDPEAFRSLMERYGSGVINLAFRFLGTVADAEDVAQDVLLALYQHPPQLDPTAKLSTWLYRVTVNRCLDLLRRPGSGRRTLSLDAPGEEEGSPLAERLPDPSAVSARERIAQAERTTFLHQAVAALPADLRTPLILSTFEELSHEEVARILRITPKAVERRLARARSLLKSRLQPYL
jgi:RNA polymerase sigma-70 factor (ECF subfamily)